MGKGTTSAQGPERPYVEFDSSLPPEGHGGDPRYVSLYAMARVPDGRIAKLVVDFGDGTRTTFEGDPNPCRRSLDGWPLESHAWLPAAPDPPPYHYFANPGTCTPTGCDDRSDVQTATDSFVWVVPA